MGIAPLSYLGALKKSVYAYISEYKNDFRSCTRFLHVVDFHCGRRASNGTASTNFCGSGATTKMDFPLVLFLQESPPSFQSTGISRERNGFLLELQPLFPIHFSVMSRHMYHALYHLGTYSLLKYPLFETPFLIANYLMLHFL